MLTEVILAVTFLFFAIGFMRWFSAVPRISTTIPGLEPSHPKKGNNDELAEAGSLHAFLSELHQQYGKIASFWMGEQLCVSIASAELFKQHSAFFDRPIEIFQLFDPLLTHASIQYANGSDGKKRRLLYDPTYSHEAVMGDHMPVIIQITEDMVRNFLKVSKDEHVSLEENMFQFALKSICETSFGTRFRDDEQVNNFKKNYDICWTHMDEILAGVDHSEEDKEAFLEGKESLISLIKEVISERRDVEGGALLIDRILTGNLPDDVVAADALTYFIGGTHTTGLALTWCLYYLAGRPDIQEKCYTELVEKLGDEVIDARVINDLTYLRQVLDETLRCSTLAPYAARFSDTDTKLGGHIVPAGTPVIHALGVTLDDEDVWPEPTKFDPDRFEKTPAPYTFEPFGFAGKRKCPGYRFAYMEATVFLSSFLRKFKVKLAPGTDVDIDKVYSLVTRPREEIFVILEKR